MPYGVTGRTRTGGLVIPNQARCHLRYCHILPVSPGCQAAASVFALTPITSGCPASVFPIRFRGFSRASSLWAEIWAEIRSQRALYLYGQMQIGAPDFFTI